MIDSAPVAEEPAVEQAPVEETPVVAAPVAAEPVVTTPAPVAKSSDANRASAPMTRAPAPGYVPEAPRHSDWVRPSFNFDGKGSAGGHSATHTATAEPTRPQSVE